MKTNLSKYETRIFLAFIQENLRKAQVVLFDGRNVGGKYKLSSLLHSSCVFEPILWHLWGQDRFRKLTITGKHGSIFPFNVNNKNIKFLCL